MNSPLPGIGHFNNGLANRIMGAGYDANGMTQPPGSGQFLYDYLNRLVSANSNQEAYSYESANKRIWKRKSDGPKRYTSTARMGSGWAPTR